MKKSHLLIMTLLGSFSLEALAHCPSHLQEEKVCFMLEKNLLYVYDSHLEHNGPYKDFKKAILKDLKNNQQVSLKFSKVARGIYKIDSPQNEKEITASFVIDKRNKDIKIQHEP